MIVVKYTISILMIIAANSDFVNIWYLFIDTFPRISTLVLPWYLLKIEFKTGQLFTNKITY